MPNSTCDFASFFASAKSGVDDRTPTHATVAIAVAFIADIRPLYRTCLLNRASDMPWLDGKIRPFLHDLAGRGLRKTGTLSYNSRPEVGPRAHVGAAAAAFLSFEAAPLAPARCGHERPRRFRRPVALAPVAVAARR